MKHYLLIALSLSLAISCTDPKKADRVAVEKDAIDNKAADEGKAVEAPDNTDEMPGERPEESIADTQLDTTLLFETWTSDPEAPHADFVFSPKSFYIVDYDGDGDMPYELKGDHLKIYYDDFIQYGEILSVTKDSLAIRWRDADVAYYVSGRITNIPLPLYITKQRK